MNHMSSRLYIVFSGRIKNCIITYQDLWSPYLVLAALLGVAIGQVTVCRFEGNLCGWTPFPETGVWSTTSVGINGLKPPNGTLPTICSYLDSEVPDLPPSSTPFCCDCRTGHISL